MNGADRAMTTLHRGSDQLAEVLWNSGRQHRRIEEIRELAEGVAWGFAMTGTSGSTILDRWTPMPG
jgi:hypothetical protein